MERGIGLKLSGFASFKDLLLSSSLLLDTDLTCISLPILFKHSVKIPSNHLELEHIYFFSL